MKCTKFAPKTLGDAMQLAVTGYESWPAERRDSEETEAFVAAMSRYIRPGMRVLDFGCGYGRIAKRLISLPIELQAWDNSEDMRKLAESFVADTRLTIAHPFGKYDLIYSVFVMQHVPAIDLRDTLRLFSGSLVAGGLWLDCSHVARHAIRFDGGELHFFDDRILGVDLNEEKEKFFDTVGPVFTVEESRQECVRNILNAHSFVAYKPR